MGGEGGGDMKEVFLGNERERDGCVTSMLSISIQEVQHLVPALHCHSECMQATKPNEHVFIDVASRILPTSTLSH